MAEKLAYLFGFSGYREPEKERLLKSNIKSVTYLAGVVILVELWMIFRIFKIAYFGQEHRTLEWVLQHLRLYVILLSSGIVVMLHALRCRWTGKFSLKTAGTIQVLFMTVCIGFGIYISYLDYIKNEQVLCFVTMLILSVCFYIWRPFVTVIITTAATVIFYVLCDAQIPVSIGMNINLFTTWLAITMAGIRGYHGIINH